MTNPTGKSARLNYRPDIDGLRAVAVLAVVIFHMPTLSRHLLGGYVGVDVFFVISGYLISSVIFSEIANGQFSVESFYERRIRRIFPALTCMLALISVAAYFALFPPELETYVKSLLAATLSASNFYFWQHSGYFDSPLSNLLLHTWSLAVEEQFYILFPIFLIIVRRFFPGKIRLGVLVLAAVSFAISIVVTRRDPSSSFYMPYTRAWELLLGTILSLHFLPPMRSAMLRNLATISGLAAIAISCFLYSPATPFPGLAAALPCLGAALIIGAGEAGPTYVGKLLSLRPVVFVGLISYSLYLWHWPLIVLQSKGVIYGNRGSHVLGTALVLALSFLLAILSWRFVERPFRSGPLRLAGGPLFRLAAVTSGALVVFALVVIVARGFPSRFPPQADEVASYIDAKESISLTRLGSCFITSTNRFSDFDVNKCLHMDPARKNYLLLGDSHSAMLWHSLSAALPDRNIMQASASGCKPIMGTQKLGSADCVRVMNFIYNDFLPNHRVDYLLLAGRWSSADIPALSKLVAWTKENNLPLVIFGPTQEYDDLLPRLLAYSITRSDPEYAYKHRDLALAPLDQQLQDLAANVWHVQYISLLQAVCQRDGCVEYADQQKKVPLMFDRDHFSEQGSELVVSSLSASHQLP